MFEHLIAGELIFLFLGQALGFDITPLFLIVGAFWGFSPDILSYFLNKKLNYRSKYFHLHRDNLSHSLLLPLIIFLLTWLIGGWKISLLISVAALTHPLLDLFGIGWGVKLFLPFSQKVFKLFYGGKILMVFKDNKDRDHHIRKYEVDDWFARDYFSLRQDTYGVPWWWAIFEWGSLVLAILLPLFYLLKM
ncbi:MAG: metal-dependent hydrolase [Patescibacteria group bacterium]|nr:metal-dependent hydrolase [Patescibacteria group bacterium]